MTKPTLCGIGFDRRTILFDQMQLGLDRAIPFTARQMAVKTEMWAWGQGEGCDMDPHDIIEHRPIENRPGTRRMEGLPRIEFRSSTFAWLFQSGTGWIILALSAAVMAGGAYAGYWWQTLVVLAVVLGVYIAWTHLENRTSLFWIDDQRLFMRRGILMRSEEEIELYRIKDVKVSFSVIQQMFNAGTVQITSSDASGSLKPVAPTGRTSIIVTHVRHARAIRAELRDRVEAIRQKRGVREFDLG